MPEHKASDYVAALQYLLSYTYDIVILDVMGVDGFDILRKSVSRGFPTVMLTAHALSSESLKRSIKLGAVSFLPKEKLLEIQSFLEDVVLSGDSRSVKSRNFDQNVKQAFATQFSATRRVRFSSVGSNSRALTCLPVSDSLSQTRADVSEFRSINIRSAPLAANTSAQAVPIP